MEYGLFDLLPIRGIGDHKPVKAEDNTYLKVAEVCRGRAANTVAGQRQNGVITDARYEIWLNSDSIKCFARKAYISETKARTLDKHWSKVTGRDQLTKEKSISDSEFLANMRKQLGI